MSIRQINGEWVCAQDRILFRFSTTQGQEFRLWLTRHIVKNFIQGCQGLRVKALERSHPPQVARAVQEFEQQRVMQQADFGKTYEAQPELPMGDAPGLVTRLKIQVKGQQTGIDFGLENGHNLHLDVTQDLMQVIVGLFDKLQALAQWNVGVQADPTAQVTPGGTASTLVH